MLSLKGIMLTAKLEALSSLKRLELLISLQIHHHALLSVNQAVTWLTITFSKFK
jgi:hypothetical protein